MSIQLGGQSFTEDQVIAAIAASNDPAGSSCLTMTIEELSGAYQALMLRVATLEQEHPHRHAGFNVTRTEDSVKDCVKYKMQTQDPVGRTIYITFEIPNDAGGSAAY